MFRKIQVLIYLISLIQQPLSADSSFVLSVTEFKTKISRAFENEIRVSFLLIVKYHVMNTCSNFKVPISSKFLFSHVILYFLQLTSTKIFSIWIKSDSCFMNLKKKPLKILFSCGLPVPLITGSTCSEL